MALPTSWVVAAAVTVAVVGATRSPLPAVMVAVVAVGRRRAVLAAALAVLCTVVTVRADEAWRSLAPERPGPFDGWAEVVGDPQRFPSATRVVVELDGERAELWVRGRASRQRADRWRGGELVRLAGDVVPLDDDRLRRVAWQHVGAELRVSWLGDTGVGAPIATAANRLRAVIVRGAAVLGHDDAALARGLVIGDDRDQSPEMIERFRASGLAHLSAVSGQNVAFVVAAAGPLLRRARPGARWLATIGLIGWFVVLTRAEPSVLRAATMAGLSATAFALGREREPLRLLGLAVVGLVLVDPLLVWSVGFWLSVGATAGVVAAGPVLARRLHRLGPLALPVGITIGAQVGVALPSLLVFERLPFVGTFANLLAVPVAGFVMLYGLPACLLAGSVPPVAGLVMTPVRLGVRWIDAVATVGAALEPPAPWSWIGWLLVAAVVAALVIRSPSSSTPSP